MAACDSITVTRDPVLVEGIPFETDGGTIVSFTTYVSPSGVRRAKVSVNGGFGPHERTETLPGCNADTAREMSAFYARLATTLEG